MSLMICHSTEWANILCGRAAGFGMWEQLFYGEFDGRRCKRVLVKIIGE